MIDLTARPELIEMMAPEHPLEAAYRRYKRFRNDSSFSEAFDSMLLTGLTPSFKSLSSLSAHIAFSQLFESVKIISDKPASYAPYLPKRAYSFTTTRRAEHLLRRYADTYIRYIHASLLASPRSWNYIPDTLLT